LAPHGVTIAALDLLNVARGVVAAGAGTITVNALCAADVLALPLPGADPRCAAAVW